MAKAKVQLYPAQFLVGNWIHWTQDIAGVPLDCWFRLTELTQKLKKHRKNGKVVATEIVPSNPRWVLIDPKIVKSGDALAMLENSGFHDMAGSIGDISDVFVLTDGKKHPLALELGEAKSKNAMRSAELVEEFDGRTMKFSFTASQTQGPGCGAPSKHDWNPGMFIAAGVTGTLEGAQRAPKPVTSLADLMAASNS